MILALGARGLGFDSRLSPMIFANALLVFPVHQTLGFLPAFLPFIFPFCSLSLYLSISLSVFPFLSLFVLHCFIFRVSHVTVTSNCTLQKPAVKFPFLTSHFLLWRLTSCTCPQVFSSTISFYTAVANLMWIFKQVPAHKNSTRRNAQNGRGYWTSRRKKEIQKNWLKRSSCLGECWDAEIGKGNEFHSRKAEYLTTHSEWKTGMISILQCHLFVCFSARAKHSDKIVSKFDSPARTWEYQSPFSRMNGSNFVACQYWLSLALFTKWSIPSIKSQKGLLA